MEIRETIETIQTSAMINWLEYWKDSERPEETCCHPDLSYKPAAKAGLKFSEHS